MSDLTSALATGHEFTHNGKTYKVSLVTQKIQAKFEEKQFARARDSAIMLKSAMSQEEYFEFLNGLSDAHIAGEFGLTSKRGIELAQSNSGVLTLCSLLFNVPEDEMTKILLERKADVTALVQGIIKESYGIKDEPVVAQSEGFVTAPVEVPVEPIQS